MSFSSASAPRRRGEKPGPEERLGGFGKPVEHPPREDEPLPGEIIRTGKTVLGAKLLHELEGVGLVREEAVRPPFHVEAVLADGAHLPAGHFLGLEQNDLRRFSGLQQFPDEVVGRAQSRYPPSGDHDARHGPSRSLFHRPAADNTMSRRARMNAGESFNAGTRRNSEIPASLAVSLRRMSSSWSVSMCSDTKLTGTTTSLCAPS